jgi:hypothetical protein
MKENMKRVYLTPAVQVKSVAVENGFSASLITTEQIGSFEELVNF